MQPPRARTAERQDHKKKKKPAADPLIKLSACTYIFSFRAQIYCVLLVYLWAGRCRDNARDLNVKLKCAAVVPLVRGPLCGYVMPAHCITYTSRPSQKMREKIINTFTEPLNGVVVMVVQADCLSN